MRLSMNFYEYESVRSPLADRLGIPVAHTPETFKAAKALAENVLQPLRTRAGRLDVTSWLRPAKLQEAIYAPALAKVRDPAALVSLLQTIHGSQHLKGEAADIYSPSLSRGQVLALLRKCVRDGVEFDQCIVYDNQDKDRIIHLSFAAGRPQRMQALASPSPGVYRPFLL